MFRSLCALMLCLALATVAQAQMYFINGIDGREVGTSQPNSVDIVLNGNCVLKGVTYQQITPPLAVLANRYTFEVRYATGSCSGPISATGSFNVALNESVSVISHLNEQGVPSITKFSNDPRPTEGITGRLVVRHTAGVEPVQIRLRRLSAGSSRTFGGYLPIVRNGEQQTVELGGGKYTATIYSTVGFRQKVAASEVTLADDKFLAVYAVGSLKGKTFALILQNLDTLR